MENNCNFSLDGSVSNEVWFEPWEFESRSEAGFLLGDPVCLYKSCFGADVEFAYVLNRQSVLRSKPAERFIDMLYVDELANDKGVKTISVNIFAFSLNGETVYVVSDEAITAWDISNGELKAEKCTGSRPNCVVAVRDGVLFRTSSNILELWNFELSQCIRRWTDLGNIHKVFPISEERVACVGEEVIIVDTTSGDIVSTIKNYHGTVDACNSKCQLITTMLNDFNLSIQCWDVQNVLWKRCFRSNSFPRPMFSPAEQFVLIAGGLLDEHHGDTITNGSEPMFVLDAVSGRTLHILCPGNWILDYRFVSDEECVVCSLDLPRGYYLRLFNVKSGDLLSVLALERDGFYLAACPRKRLIAIGLSHAKHKFQVIRVKLPQDQDSRKSKRISIKSKK